LGTYQALNSSEWINMDEFVKSHQALTAQKKAPDARHANIEE
jgi:hypothetical protein